MRTLRLRDWQEDDKAFIKWARGQGYPESAIKWVLEGSQHMDTPIALSDAYDVWQAAYKALSSKRAKI